MIHIAIIGGGPAGLSSAIEAAKNGAAVTLFEKGKIDDNIRCAEGFFDTTNTLGKPSYGVKYKVREIVLRLKLNYSFPCGDKINIWMLDRAQWQIALAKEAENLGVKIVENCLVNKEIFQKIAAQNNYVIDASGAPSITSRIFNFNSYYIQTSAVTAQYRLRGDFDFLMGKLKAGFEEHYLGYYWIFPKSSEEANVGIGFYQSNTLRNKNLNIWSELDRVIEKEGLSSCERLHKSGGLCPVRQVNKLVYQNIILTGDAAGLASPLHAGGIDTACISGKIAAQCILNGRVESYKDDLDKALGKKLSGDRALFEIWSSLKYNDMDKIVGLLNRSAAGQFGFKDLFNGAFSALKNIKALKSLMKHI
jgi:digeranylgeranylglycerophospholipid reductase